MSVIKDCADAYNRLCGIEYYIMLGRKGRSVSLRLAFTEDEFYHLAGFHKMTDVYKLRSESRDSIWQSALDGTLSDDELGKSYNYQVSLNRQRCIIKLEEMLDGDDLYFRFSDTKWSYGKKWSKIKAEFLIEYSDAGGTIFLFLDKEDDHYICRSIFPKEEIDYSRNQTKFTLLRKEKLYKETGNLTCLYEKPLLTIACK